MPCNTIQRSSVKLELRADNLDLLAEALRVHGFSVQLREDNIFFTSASIVGTFKDGKLSLTGEKYAVSRFDLNAIKRGYSQQIVKSAARKMGWELNTAKEDPLKIKVRRRF